MKRVILNTLSPFFEFLKMYFDRILLNDWIFEAVIFGKNLTIKESYI